MTQPLPGAHAVSAENELDIRGLFRTLWAGKLWIVGIGLAFALIALAYTFFARQEWSATAISDRPTPLRSVHAEINNPFRPPCGQAK